MDAVPRFRTGRSVEQTIRLTFVALSTHAPNYGANVTRYVVQDGVWTPGTQVT